MVLDGFGGCDCIPLMKTSFLVILLGVAVLAAGCITTVDNQRVAAVPFVKDSISGQYQRPLDQVFDAAKAVIQFNGTLNSSSTLYGETNMVKAISGRVKQSHVWVRVEQVQPTITGVTVEARTNGGAANIDLAAELEKQIALKLVE
ncbi:MAG TPA: DUF3568 family protein [Verrucomicrobiae bacterium]|nr:DUF3568 family protein [Verrucomicrobiae bacterium]